MGYKRSPINPVGGNRHGVIRISRFFTEKTGNANADIPLGAWFAIPKIRSRLGWKPKYTIYDAVRQMFDFYVDMLLRM